MAEATDKVLLEFPTEPSLEPAGIGNGYIWRSSCGRYYAARLLGRYGVDPRFVAAEVGRSLIYPKGDYRIRDGGYATLGQALRACADHLATKGRVVQTNEQAVVAAAVRSGLDTLPRGGDNTVGIKGGKQMQIDQAKIHHLFQVMDFKTEEGWEITQYQRKLTGVLEAFTREDLESQVEDDPEAAVIMQQLLTAREAKEDVVIVDGKAAAASNGKAASKPKGKAAPAAAAAEAEPDEDDDHEEAADSAAQQPAKAAGKKGKGTNVATATATKPKAAAKGGKPKAAAARQPSGPRDITTTRTYLAGQILKKHGIDSGVTDAMVKDLDKAAGKQNERESLFCLRNALNAIKGFKANK